MLGADYAAAVARRNRSIRRARYATGMIDDIERRLDFLTDEKRIKGRRELALAIHRDLERLRGTI